MGTCVGAELVPLLSEAVQCVCVWVVFTASMMFFLFCFFHLSDFLMVTQPAAVYEKHKLELQLATVLLSVIGVTTVGGVNIHDRPLSLAIWVRVARELG